MKEMEMGSPFHLEISPSTTPTPSPPSPGLGPAIELRLKSLEQNVLRLVDILTKPVPSSIEPPPSDFPTGTTPNLIPTSASAFVVSTPVPANVNVFTACTPGQVPLPPCRSVPQQDVSQKTDSWLDDVTLSSLLDDILYADSGVMSSVTPIANPSQPLHLPTQQLRPLTPENPSQQLQQFTPLTGGEVMIQGPNNEHGLSSPEKALVRVPGKDVHSLRRLAIVLARGCYFGDDVLEASSIAGKGGLCSLGP